MSALPPIADIRWCRCDVREVPITDLHLRQPRRLLSLSAPLLLGSTSHGLSRHRISAGVCNTRPPFLNCLLRVISGHEGQLFAGFPRVKVALICVGSEAKSCSERHRGFPFSCQSLSVIRSSELENRAPDQDGRKSVRSFANVKRVCVDSGLWRVAIFVQRPSLTHSFRTDAKSGA